MGYSITTALSKLTPQENRRTPIARGGLKNLSLTQFER
jgi:hypothetical protein